MRSSRIFTEIVVVEEMKKLLIGICGLPPFTL
jgi:hypothetical protein